MTRCQWCSRHGLRLDEGEAAIRAYLELHTAQGQDHVLDLITEDNNHILRLIGDLTEKEAETVTDVDEWRVFDALQHMNSSLDRSRGRLQKLSTGQAFVPPATGVTSGGVGSAEYASFSDLRRPYIDGMGDILSVIRAVDPSQGFEVAADHGQYGPFNWMEGALYSHHVHMHDHVVRSKRYETRFAAPDG